MGAEPNGADVDVLVVGAGLSGLRCAERLAKAGASVRVLEALDRVGGRTLGATVGGVRADLGGQWIGPGQERVAALARELGVETVPQRTTGRRLLRFGDDVVSFAGRIPKLPIASLAEMQWAVLRLDSLRKCAGGPLESLSDRARQLDEMSVRAWIERNLRTARARGFLAMVVRAVCAAEPAELSMLHFLRLLEAGGGFYRVAEVRGGAQQDFFAGGAQQLALRLASQLQGSVRLSSPVASVVQSETGVTVTTASAEEHRARFAVIAVPPVLASRVQFTPALPLRRQQLLERLHPGSAIKCVVAYTLPFWRNAGFTGDALCDTGAVGLVLDGGTDSVSGAGTLIAFILGDEVRRWSDATPAARRDAVLGSLARLFGDAALRPADYAEQDWSREPWTRGCYTVAAPPGVSSAYASSLRAPHGRVHWAGTETAEQWTGFLDGAIAAGERAAGEVIQAIRATRTTTRAVQDVQRHE